MSVISRMINWVIEFLRNVDDKISGKDNANERVNLNDSNEHPVSESIDLPTKVIEIQQNESLASCVLKETVKHEAIISSKFAVQARIKSYLVMHNVVVSDGVIESLYRELGKLSEVETNSELNEAIIRYKQYGVFTLDEIPYIKLIIDKSGEMIRFERLTLRNEEQSNHQAVKEAIYKQFESEDITCTDFRVNSLAKDYVGGNRQSLCTMINQHRILLFNDYRKTITPKVKNATSGDQEYCEYSSDYEYSNDSYTENDPGGGVADDIDSFDYADDFGKEDIY